MNDPHELMSCKELAAALHRNVSFLYAMRRHGFRMPGDRGTLQSARDWLAVNGGPWTKAWEEHPK